MSDEKPYETIKMSYKDSYVVNLLYNTMLGRQVLSLLIKPSVSKIFGLLMNCRVSSFLIPIFINNNKICLDEYKDVKYISFNDFFTREVKENFRPISENRSEVIAPCDGKLTVYRITGNSVLRIKNSMYDVNSLLQDKPLCDEFINGICLIFRLMPHDYHRYCYIDDGEFITSRKIKGVLHTVRPIASKRYNIYTQNSREYAVLQTENFGKVIQMEVGALFVGRIINLMKNGVFKRGEEKGMFEFGGSTVVMLFQKGAIKVDDIIWKNTRENKETIVKMGNKIGEKNILKKER